MAATLLLTKLTVFLVGSGARASKPASRVESTFDEGSGGIRDQVLVEVRKQKCS